MKTQKKRWLFLQLGLLFFAHYGYAQDWQTLFRKASALQEAGNYPEAIIASKQALHQAETTFGKEHTNYAQSLLQLGAIQSDEGDYGGAETNLVASRNIYKKLNATRDTNYVEVLFSLGILYRIQSKFPLSASCFQEGIQLTEEVRGKDNAYYAGILGGLGNLYLISGEFDKAEPLLLNVLALKAKLLGKENNDYASTLNSLGMLYSYKEDYVHSESYLQEGLRIREKVLGSGHPSVAYMLNNLGFLYMNQGAYEAAIRLYNRAIGLNEKRASTSQVYLTSVNNVAECYRHIKQYEKADSLYDKSLEIIAKSLGTDHPQYAILLNNKGMVQEDQRHFQAARDIYEKAIDIYTIKMGEDQIVTTTILNNLANVYWHVNEADKADSLYRKTLTIIGKQVGVTSLQYAMYLNNYALFFDDKNQIDSAFAVLMRAQTIVESNLTKNFLYQTYRQRENLLTKWAPVTRSIFELAQKYPKRIDFSKLAYSGNLFLKNILLSQHINLFINASKTSVKLIDTLQRVSNQVAAQYALPIKLRRNIDSLETKAELLEKDLARQSVSFRQAQQSIQVRWEDIRNALKPNEAAVEFVSFFHNNGVQKIDSLRYIALVLRPGDEAPQLVSLLTDEAPLRRLLARKTESSAGAGLYATRGSEIDTDQLTRGDSLYRLIWQPIDRLLTGVKTVYLAPSGLLHQVSFAALPYRDSRKKDVRYLTDRYQLRQVGSTRQVVTQTHQVDTYQNLTSARLYGGIQYDTVIAPLVASSTIRLPITSKSLRSLGGWPYLPGTRQEVEQIGRLIGPKAIVVTGVAANETALKSLSGQSPDVLHIATHGFAFPDPTGSPDDSSVVMSGAMFRRIANPLLRTGLLMAGANRAWQGERPAVGQDDGILTAYEVANLNLSTTKLVVLSACETALGDIRGSEGVFGLQRAFKMAGAGYLLISLWPVADQATSDLMTQFYREWKKHRLIRKAFEQTQLLLRKKYPPSVWAAFVLIE